MPNTYSLTQYARQALDICPEIGRWDPIASGSATTIVVTQLATGGLPSSAFERQWAVRREAASQPADRVRMITAFASDTGTSTVGTMADTTFTSENVEILRYHPNRLDRAVNWALNYLRREDTVTVPVLPSRTRYPMGTLLAHVRYPNDIVRVAATDSPVISQNRYLQKWNSYSSTGVLTPPDGFTLAGSAATVTRSTVQAYQSPYTAALTRAGTNATLTQNVGILATGVDADSLQGETVTVVARAYCATASAFRIRVNDGTTTTNSDYHSGNSTFAELSKEVALGASASALTFAASADTNDATTYIDQLYLVWGTLTDAVRRDEYPETVLDVDDYRFDQSAGVIELPRRSKGQWRITTRRPYPQFPSASIAGGTADAYVSDAPVEAVATVAVWKLWRDLADEVGPRDRTKFGALAEVWRPKAEGFAGHHLHQRPPSAGGWSPPFAFAPRSLRYGGR